MGDQVLLTITDHPPWTERVARTVVDTEEGDASVLLLYVFDEEERAETLANLDMEDTDVDLDELARRKEGVSKAARILDEAGLAYDVRAVERDDQAAAILDEATAAAVDRTYVYSCRRTPAGKAIFGSTLQDVIIGAANPVVVVPSREDAAAS